MLKKGRLYGEHLTPELVFRKYIAPHITQEDIQSHIFVDMFCGEGNLLLPLLEYLPKDIRVDFFKERVYMFDIQPQMVQKAIAKAVSCGIPYEIASRNIQVKDTLLEYPEFLLQKGIPLFHITNPPYLYIGYVVKSKQERLLRYFKNLPYQDLYQIALYRDLVHSVSKMIYIVPTNFLFGASASNAIRRDLLSLYYLKFAIVFEKKIFEHTGVHTCVCFFERKKNISHQVQRFKVLKVNHEEKYVEYTLYPENHYRAGAEFEIYVIQNKRHLPFKIKFYLTYDEIRKNTGPYRVLLVDANSYGGGHYEKREFFVNYELYKRIKENILFVRTLDTGGEERAGVYTIGEAFSADGIYCQKPYRTHPIPIFFEPPLPKDVQISIRDYFNRTLEHLRTLTDSDFMTNFKYSDSQYTRKYLGLNQVKALLQTYPYFHIKETLFDGS